MNASLNEKLRAVKWGEYKLTQLFKPMTIRRKIKGEDVSEKGIYPAYSSDSENNGIVGYYSAPEFICDLNNPVYVVFGDHTRTMSIARNSFSVLDNVKVLRPYIENTNALLFVCSVWKKQIPNLGYKRHWSIAKECCLRLPTKNGKIDLDFMESFIAELEAQRVAELSAYLTVSGLDNYELSSKEESVLKNFQSIKWDTYNLEKLFGKSTRGKRLKGDDRIEGTLPFVTAGEASEGVSAYIGNNVEVFEKNTTTIDMFGSAKYRNYNYGADDHVAVVHTEAVPMKAAIFVTSACHKAAHTGKFDYGHNFYAKDADALDIQLPTKDGKPDYDAMAALISAVQKLVVKDVVLFANQRITATEEVVLKA